jgi:pyruvate/2-oxoglutarate/acetoin dehydrogenase E1 component
MTEINIYLTAIVSGISGSIPIMIFVFKTFPFVIQKIDNWVKEIKELRIEHHNDMKNQLVVMHTDIVEIKADIIEIKSRQESSKLNNKVIF